MARGSQGQTGGRVRQEASWKVLEARVRNWGYFLKSSGRPLIGGFSAKKRPNDISSIHTLWMSA